MIKHLEPPTPTAHTTTGPDGRRQEWAWEAGLPLTPRWGSPSSIPASVLLYLTVATVSRKEERGGKVNFPPPTQIFLASIVFTLPSLEGGVGRSTPIQVSLPRRRTPNPARGAGQASCGPEPGTPTLLRSPEQGGGGEGGPITVMAAATFCAPASAGPSLLPNTLCGAGC